MPKIILRTIIVLTYLLVSISSYSQIQKTQAAFLFNFALFINWPPEYQVGDFEIVVLGNSEIIKELESLTKDKKIGEQTIKVKKVNSPKDIDKANIIFIPESQTHLLKEILKVTDQKSILIVTEFEGLGRKGAAINFLVADGKLKFELNLSQAEKRGLKMAEKLIKLGIPIN